MTKPISPNQQVLYIPYTDYSITVDKTHLIVIQCMLALSFLGGTGIGFAITTALHRAQNFTSHYDAPFSKWGYILDAVTALSGLCLFGTFCKKAPPEQQNTFSDGEMMIVEELCNREEKCSLDRVKKIVDYLKKNNRLEVLNALPEPRIGAPGGHSYTHETHCTPLQYWASEGHLEICKLFIKNGALDYRSGYNNTSALYEAAFYGHAPIVKYFIEKGFTPEMCFQNNPLYYFIPKFAFEMITCKNHLEYKPSFECFRLILNSYRQSKIENLEFQFKIPVDEREENILGWLKKKEQIAVHQKTMIQELKSLLIQFGASEKAVLRKADLQSISNIGTGMTLDEIARLKN